MFEALAAAALHAAKAKITRKLTAWCVALIPVIVVVWVVGAMLLAMMFMGAQQPSTQASGDANGCVVAAPIGVTGTGLSGVQLANAATIIAVGKRLKVPPSGWAVAIAVALTESGMLALDFGDRDSLGMMQQRAPWGTVAQRMNVATSSAMFFQGGHGGQPGLLSLAGWQQMPLSVAAQSVQHSAPSAYAAHEAVARLLSGAPAMAGASCTGGSGFGGDAAVGGLQPATIGGRDAISAAFPGLVVGCLRTGIDAQDHATGLACDFMVTPDSVQGQAIADFVQAAAASGTGWGAHVAYAIYRQHIWNIGRQSEGWRPMPDRGSITANHFDHVHVSFQQPTK